MFSETWLLKCLGYQYICYMYLIKAFTTLAPVKSGSLVNYHSFRLGTFFNQYVNQIISKWSNLFLQQTQNIKIILNMRNEMSKWRKTIKFRQTFKTSTSLLVLKGQYKKNITEKTLQLFQKSYYYLVRFLITFILNLVCTNPPEGVGPGTFWVLFLFLQENIIMEEKNMICL